LTLIEEPNCLWIEDFIDIVGISVLSSVVPMEITFMDNGGHIFVLDEFIKQMNSHM
jgi:hypothetical protein